MAFRKAGRERKKKIVAPPATTGRHRRIWDGRTGSLASVRGLVQADKGDQLYYTDQAHYAFSAYYAIRINCSIRTKRTTPLVRITRHPMPSLTPSLSPSLTPSPSPSPSLTPSR